MDTFDIFLELGLNHILDINGYDHILFIVALCTPYCYQNWRKILLLATSFTLGHSFTLALVSLDIVRVDPYFIEILIPTTIAVTVVSNLKNNFVKTGQFDRYNYLIALFFGFIHGMGFSSYLKSLLGSETSIISCLFAFNVGLEIGQIIVIIIYLLLSLIFVNIIGLRLKIWRLILSCVVGFISVILILERIV